MNLLQKQGFYNSLILYIGVALGFFNLIILFQRVLSTEQIGFFQLMLAVSVIYAQVASLGVNGVILKYFPYYRHSQRTYGGLVTLVFCWTIFSFLLTSLLFLLFKDTIVHHYDGKPGVSLLLKYYNYLIPISFLTLIFTVFESLARVVFKNILSAFLKEVVLRVCTTAAVLLTGSLFISYDGFLDIYLLANGLIAAILAVDIVRGKHFALSDISPELKKQRKELLDYGFFSVLGAGSFPLMQNMAIFMLTEFTDSLTSVGVYGTFFGIAVVISLPAKALGRTSYQIVAEAWAKDDLEKINRIYYKTSLVQLLIGSLLLIGLIVNRDLLLNLLHKPDYKNYFNVFIVIGLTFLVDITGGLNGQIINLSRYYRLTTLLVTASVFFCAGLNFILIPHLGLLGAAIAYLLTVTALNLVYCLFLKNKFSLQPFGKQHGLVIIISLIALSVGVLTPAFKNLWIDSLIKSVLVTAAFSTLTYYLKISEDVNSFINMAMSKVLKLNRI